MEMETIICIRAVCADPGHGRILRADTFRIFVSKEWRISGVYAWELFPGAFTKDDIEKARVY